MCHFEMAQMDSRTYEIMSRYLGSDGKRVSFSPDCIIIKETTLTSELVGLPAGTFLQQAIIFGNKIELYPDYPNIDRIEFNVDPLNGNVRNVYTINFQPPRYNLIKS